jgi:hypothetical protein
MNNIQLALIKTGQSSLVHKYSLGSLLGYLYRIKRIREEYLMLRQMGIKVLEMDINGVGIPFTEDQQEKIISILSKISNNNKCCNYE